LTNPATGFNFSHFLYPPLCLHCQALLAKRLPLFCKECLEQLSLLEVKERCWTCLGPFYKGRCERCIHRPLVIHKQLAACEAYGPAGSLLKGLEMGRKECVQPAASLMAYQWLEQKMPLPDFLLPLPVSFWQKQKSGFDINWELASAVGRIFSVPVSPLLKRRFDTTQFLTQGEFRARIQPKLKSSDAICDKRLLLIAPLLNDRELRSAGEGLKAYFPTQIDALCFAAHLE
jgi:predicted amidophosphoribosyltransferase